MDDKDVMDTEDAADAVARSARQQPEAGAPWQRAYLALFWRYIPQEAGRLLEPVERV